MKWLWIAVVLMAGFAQAAVYEWVDDAGRKQFSDEPPNNGLPYKRRYIDTPPVHVVPATPVPKPRQSPANARSTAHVIKKTPRSQGGVRCKRYEAEIKRIEKRMRNGYRGDEGNRLKRSRRYYSDKYYKECR